MTSSNISSRSNLEPTLTSDLRELRFTLRSTPATRSLSLPGVIDVGEGGRLLGLEVDLSTISDKSRLTAGAWISAGSTVSYYPDDKRLYLSIMDEEGDQSRSAPLPVTVGFDDVGALVELAIARRGAGYEITYPSGNR